MVEDKTHRWDRWGDAWGEQAPVEFGGFAFADIMKTNVEADQDPLVEETGLPVAYVPLL